MRRAKSNYIDVEHDTTLAPFEHLQSFRGLDGAQGPAETNDGRTVTAPPSFGNQQQQQHDHYHYQQPQPANSHFGIFELLQAKFGFQQSSAANQKEHFACWITNYQLRVQEEGIGGLEATRAALTRVHKKFFKNYLRWCKFLRTQPIAETESMEKMEKQLALLLLIWGEAGNLRFMPECICFLYHNMANKLTGIETLPDMPEGHYLERIVRPMYDVIARMRTTTAPAGAKPLDHQDITNYDDVNEFFWNPYCLDFDELNVAEVVGLQDPKTFKEKRSVFNPLLAFFRIWYFLVVMFHIMVAIVYVCYRADTSVTNSFTFYSNFFVSGLNKVRAHTMYSVMITITGLLMVKVILQIWLYGNRLFKDMWLVIGVFCRLLWHTLFFGLFILVNVSPNEDAFFGSLSSILPGGGTSGTYLSMGLIYSFIYGVPVLASAFFRTFCSSGVWNIRVLNSLDGTKHQFIGRHMIQPWAPYTKYALSWLVIFAAKFLFSIQFMIKPLIGPSVDLYNVEISDEQRSNGIFESNHNIAFIGALWTPVFFVYMYDTQIWFILFQSIVGMVMGMRMKIGHYVGLIQLKAALYTAPLLFDQTIVSGKAKDRKLLASTSSGGDDASHPKKLVHHDTMSLRFAIIWNEVISNFRMNDLLDDRETVILQYRIVGRGEKVQEPIFLLVGKLAKAIEIANKSRINKWRTAALVKALATADTLDGVKNGLELVRDMFYVLLGEGERNGALSVLEYIYNSPDITSLLNLTYAPVLADNMVELLAAILDMPEDITNVDSVESAPHEVQREFHNHVTQVIEHVRAIFLNLETMLDDESVSRKLMKCSFLQMTPDLNFQKQQLFALYKADAVAETGFFSVHSHDFDDSSASSSQYSSEDFISGCTRLFFLLRLDVAKSLPRCEEANRRMGFFLHSLSMDMPHVSSLNAMPSFSVMTPYYSETVMFTLDELRNPVHSNPLFEALDEKQKVKGRSELSIMRYLITFHAEEWSNFLERMGVSTLEEALDTTPMQVRLWASLRGQTLARTVHGMMMYEDALRLLCWLELYNVPHMDDHEKIAEMNRMSALKFSYITGCQIYSQQVAKGDHRAADIDFLMKKFPSWRVSFVDTITVNDGQSETKKYDCVLVKAEGNEIVEVYRYELPGNPILGEGKPENQNVALPFTRGEYLQTIDMNQEHYFEETLKMPNFLATAVTGGEEVTIIGMKEHVFTGRASSLARFMTLQELVFVTLTQRVLAKPLRSRMHYGHPDVFEKSFVMTNGGVSKASKGINLSEDVFSGYNVTLRGGLVTHVEFMQCGKGRDVTLSQINAFEAKLSNGCAESCLSREGHRMSANLDFFRLNSMFYGHFGFYICNALTVLCVYIYSYAKLYVATHEELAISAVMEASNIGSLSAVMSTQYVLQFGMLTTLPLLATLVVEFGFKRAALQITELISCLGIVFYVFLTGTKAHFYDVALIRGGSKYRGTGRGFSITRDPMVNFFKEYGVSHFRKAVELIGIMILFGMYGNFNIGANALQDYCEAMNITDCDIDSDEIPSNITSLESYSETEQSFGLASFAVLFLGACWLLAPFLFNTDGLVWQKTKIDVGNWFAWMMRVKRDDDLIEEGTKNSSTGSGAPKDGWLEWWASELESMEKLGGMGRLTYCVRELRHPLAMYYCFITQFELTLLPLLIALVGGVWFLLWFLNRASHFTLGKNQKVDPLTIRGILYMICAVGGIAVIPVLVGLTFGWSFLKSVTLSVSLFLGLNSVLQYALAMHGVFGMPVAMWTPVITLGFLFDMLVGVFLVIPLLVLSFLPFMRILQTRMMYNGGFSRALSSGSEVAASLCIFLGLLCGFVFGFMTSFMVSLDYVNDTSDNFISRSFYYFIDNKMSDGADSMLSFISDGYLKVFCAISSIVGILFSMGFGHFFNRRINMLVGGVLIIVSLILNFISVNVTIILACTLASAGSAIVATNYLQYCFEICTRGWRGKSVAIFVFGGMIGYLIHAIIEQSVNSTTIADDFGNKPVNNWRLVPMYVIGPLTLLLFVVLWFCPESPTWLLRHNAEEQAKTVLIRLRRRQNVTLDIAAIQSELSLLLSGRALSFRLGFVFALQGLFGWLMSHALLYRVQVKTDGSSSDGKDTSLWLVNFAICSTVGLGLGTFLVDNVRRKTILKEFLPFTAIASVMCAIMEGIASSQGQIVQGFLICVYLASGLSLMSVTWLSAMEMFPASKRSLYFPLSFCMYYLVQLVVYLWTPSFVVSHLLFAAGCIAITVVLFLVCASTKFGAIQLKTEKSRQKEEAVRLQIEQQAEQQREQRAVSAEKAVDAHLIAALDEAEEQERQQARIAQAALPRRGGLTPNYSKKGTTFETSGTGSGGGENAPYGRMESIESMDSSSELGTQQPPLSMVSERPLAASMSSSFMFEDEFDDDFTVVDMMNREIQYPAGQSRSQSFLQSQTFPDSQVQAETQSQRL